MSDWEFYVDESGNFEVPALEQHLNARLVCGVLVPTGTRFQQAALRSRLERAYPHWSWPLHATEFRDPMAHLIRWLARGKPALPGAESAAVAMERMAAWLTDAAMRPNLSRSFRECVAELEKPEDTRRVETEYALRKRLTAIMEVLHPVEFHTLQAYCQRSIDRVMKLLGDFVAGTGGCVVLAAPEAPASPVIDRVMASLPGSSRVYTGCLWGAIWRAGMLLAVHDKEAPSSLALRALRRGSLGESVETWMRTVTALYDNPRLVNLSLAPRVALNVDPTDSFPAFDTRSALMLVYADWAANRMLREFKPTSGSMSRVERTAACFRVPLATTAAQSVVAVGASTGDEWAARKSTPAQHVSPRWASEPRPAAMALWAVAARDGGLELIGKGGL